MSRVKEVSCDPDAEAVVETVDKVVFIVPSPKTSALLSLVLLVSGGS